MTAEMTVSAPRLTAFEAETWRMALAELETELDDHPDDQEGHDG